MKFKKREGTKTAGKKTYTQTHYIYIYISHILSLRSYNLNEKFFTEIMSLDILLLIDKEIFVSRIHLHIMTQSKNFTCIFHKETGGTLYYKTFHIIMCVKKNLI